MDMEDYDNIVPDIVYFIHRECSDTWRLEERQTDCIDIYYVMKGFATFYINQKEYHLKQGNLLCIPLGTLRSAVTDSKNPMECYSVSFRLLTAAKDNLQTVLPLISYIGIQLDIIALFEDLHTVWFRRDSCYLLKSRALFMLILHRYFELLVFKSQSVITDIRINKAIQYIIDHYSEEITIQDLSKISSLNPAYFGLLFKQSTGMTFRQYITCIRINYAENLLKSAEYNVSEVAAYCGFSDVSYFCRVYKKSRGVTPSNVFRHSIAFVND